MLRLLAADLTDREIAEALVLSRCTVHHHDLVRRQSAHARIAGYPHRTVLLPVTAGVGGCPLWVVAGTVAIRASQIVATQGEPG